MSNLAKVARRLNARHGAARRLPPLVLPTDAVRLPNPAPAVARLPRGTIVIVRHSDDGARAALARDLLPICRRRGLRLLIAGDWRLALRLGADGLHLPEAMARQARRWRRRPSWLVTAAAHSRPAMRRAAQAGADAVLLSPVFPTASHPGRGALGPVRFAALAVRQPLAVYALGGITEVTAPRLLGTGAVGIAAIGGLSIPAAAATR